MKRTADILVGVAADVYKVRRQNRPRSFRQEGSGYVPTDFQADKSNIAIPGPVFVKGWRPRLCHGLIPGLQMAAKTKKRSASCPICRKQLRRTFFFLFQRGEIGAGGPLPVQERPHDEVGWGRPNHQQKRVRRVLLAVDRPLQKVHPNRPKKVLK